MKISQRAKNVKPSALNKFFIKTNSLIKEGKDIIQLGIGDPDCETPARIKNAGIDAIQAGETHYNPASGTLALKEAIAAKYDYCSNKVTCNEVLASGGSRIILSACFWAILNPGDAIMIPSPYYPSFVRLARDYDAEIIDINTAKSNFLLKAHDVEAAIEKSTKKPKVLIINSPNNPTGAIYEKEELRKINELSKRYGFIIISDECYNSYAEESFSFREISDKAIIIDSCSKEYFMTGWRVGWGIIPEPIAKAVNDFLNLHISSFASISEKAAVEALREKGSDKYAEQREIIKRWLKQNNLNSVFSKGAFYVFPDFSQYSNKLSDGSIGLANYLLEDAAVAVAPGIDFGDFDNHLRIAYCVKPEILEKALRQIEISLKKIS